MRRYGLSYFYMRSAPSEMLKRYKRLYDIQVNHPGQLRFSLGWRNTSFQPDFTYRCPSSVHCELRVNTDVG